MATAPSHRRLQRLSRQLLPVGSAGGAVHATIPYRKATEDGDRLVFMPEGDAFDVRPHLIEDLRELGETSLLADGYVMMRNVSRANTALLCPRSEALQDPDHLREVAAERLKYRHEMEELARESFQGHTVRLVMAGGPMGELSIENCAEKVQFTPMLCLKTQQYSLEQGMTVCPMATSSLA
jgi:hypothetical protein